MSRPAGLTTTSYAILGLLAIRPWTTYELTRQMDRSLGRLWPRAQSKLYEEPKKLVAHGLARASKERLGRRPRTVYTITTKGRRALRAWLKEPGQGPLLEWEQLLKVFFADQGSSGDLRRTLAEIVRWSDAEMAVHAAVARSYLAGDAPFQHRAAVNLLSGTFLQQFAEMVGRWARWAQRVVDQWPDDPRRAEPDLRTLEAHARRRVGEPPRRRAR